MRKAWALAACGLTAFGVVVWFAGPLLLVDGHVPLESRLVRAAIIAVFCLQYVLQQLWRLWQSARNNERVVAELEPGAQPSLSPEGERLRERFTQALGELRRARFAPRGRYLSASSWKFGRSYLYQLPWYMIIGAPGAGKTTALLNSGLNFPLADKLGRGPVGGFGGTRNCDWWFTDRAVLIDTAGRYTTQDSNPSADRKAWLDFLGLLHRFRPRHPLNGVLLSISVEELLGFDTAQRAEHARVLRARLDELQTRLGTRVPVYVLLTKCDLLPGFVDWFGALDRRQREQVCGVTFDLREAQNGAAAAAFMREFEHLLDVLADDLIGRMHAERDLQRRARVFVFLSQLRSLGESLDVLLRATFAGSPQSPTGAAILLRGVYLTSGTQAGTPIDRMLSAFGRELGVERQILPPHSSAGKSFFLAQLLSDVVFAESELNARSPFRRRLQRRMLVAGLVAMQGCALALAALWLASFYRDRRDIAHLQIGEQAATFRVQAIPQSVDSDPRALLPALNSLRALTRAPDGALGSWQLLDVGNGARSKLDAAAAQAYERFLLGAFQARIANAIDATLRSGTDENVQYEALKTYAMLRDPRHFEATGFKVFVLSYWDRVLAPQLTTDERAQLSTHLDALLEAGAVGSGIVMDPTLLAAVRARLRAASGGQRLALRIEYLVQARGVGDFVLPLRDAEERALIVGADGKSVPMPVAALHTLDAFVRVVSAQAPAVGAQLATEADWVLGVPGGDSAMDIKAFFADYRADYARAWIRFLDDVHVKPASNDKEIMRQAQLLGSPDGPLARMLREVARQTPVELANGAAGPIALLDPGAPLDPGAQRLIALGRFVGGAGGDASLAGALLRFRDLQSSRLTSASDMPEPVRSMLRSMVDASTGGGQLAGRLAPACLRLVAGQFPFDRRAARDAPLDEFARMFGPGGSFDQTYKQPQSTHADATQDGERARAAARIREVFFAHGASRPMLELTFKPLDMDEDIDRFELDIDGQTIRYAHGPQIPVVVKWPGTMGQARIRVTPAAGGTDEEYTGPWALLRLMDHAAIQSQGTPGHFTVVFDSGGRHASFDVEAVGGGNPFRLRELENFSCPLTVR